MKKFISTLLVVLLASAAHSAEKVNEVSLRCDIQETATKIVLESDEDFISNTNTLVSLTIVTVNFPARFELKRQQDFIYGIVKKERSLVINLKDAADVRTYKLSSPARLVIEVKTKKEEVRTKKELQKPEQKTPEPASQPKEAQEVSPQVAPKAPGEPLLPPSHPAQKAPLPQQPEKKKKTAVIVLDPGHGGYDYGIVAQGLKEKDFDLNLAKELGSALSKKGTTVFMTRKADQNASLADRITFSNSKNPDLFISIHYAPSDKVVIYVAKTEDLSSETAVKQYSQFSSQNTYIEKSRGWARSMAESVRAEFKADVILRELPLPILNSISAPAVFIECPLWAYGPNQKTREAFVNSIMKGISGYEQ